ncbi:MAG: SIS domain-containing protein [Nitrosopumilus sp.]|uniref:D-sedoheptulose-7-phosphate isomerase n=1 Tax=Nitrosopumilus sp. TaxID=2024843 RepID=UPI00247E5671|nr:SIS domain-containing protein [Nitrosopumilus sp.]MCV0393726.1 SIS domain-containing protein [Nitrosopumilus sp.]
MEDKKREGNLLKDYVIKNINESILVKQSLYTQIPIIQKASKLIAHQLMSEGKVILLGNGGSAADAQHIAAEFVGKYALKRKGLPAMALSTNSSSVTAIGNDYGFDVIFERQLEAFATKKDIIIAISTSGNSKNVHRAVKFAKKNKIRTICMTGKNGGSLSTLADLTINVPSNNTQRIQECHIMIGHIIVGLVEQILLSKK